jgi:hypothetical protein
MHLKNILTHLSHFGILTILQLIITNQLSLSTNLYTQSPIHRFQRRLLHPMTADILQVSNFSLLTQSRNPRTFALILLSQGCYLWNVPQSWYSGLVYQLRIQGWYPGQESQAGICSLNPELVPYASIPLMTPLCHELHELAALFWIWDSNCICKKHTREESTRQPEF